MTWLWLIGSAYIIAIIYLAWEVHNAPCYPDNWPTGCLDEGDVERILERSRRIKR